MISDLLLVVRYFILTIIVIGILQIEWNNRTLEDRATEWFYTSGVSQSIRQASKGGAQLAKEGFQSTKNWIQGIVQSGHQSSRAAR